MNESTGTDLGNQALRAVNAIRTEVAKALIGQSAIIDQVLIALLAGGHVLIEGVPGLGKTLLVRALAKTFDGRFARIQFTPDLMPADVTGHTLYDQATREFTTRKGPVFTNLLLADEINRAPAKTQAALLEAMQDRTVTTDATTRALPKPFFVMATQNPVESQGTYPLPEAQLDRFLLMLSVQHPSRAAERRVVEQSLAGFETTDLSRTELSVALGADDVVAMQGALGHVKVHPEIIDYAIDIVARSRSHRSVSLGASPRGSLGLVACARANAAASGRDFVVPDDVKSFAPAVLRHRLVLSPDAELEGTTSDDVISGILNEAPVPKAVG